MEVVSFGLIGFPLKHSFSKKYFTEKFAEECIVAQYLNFEIPFVSQVMDVIQEEKGLKGFNVTIPYKQEIIPYLDELSEEANSIGAVNVVLIDRTQKGKNGEFRLKGFNSDVFGFLNSIKPLLNGTDKKALILGTGGASKAVAFALSELNIGYLYVSRNKSEETYTYEELNQDIILNHSIIINCSPLGTFPNVDTCPNLPYQYITSSHLLYDLVYNPPKTLFLQKGEEKGARTKNGYEMLELQALEAWNIWNK